MTGQDIGTVHTLHLYSCTLLVLLKNKHVFAEVLKSNDILEIVLAIILGVKTVQCWPLLLTDFFDFFRLGNVNDYTIFNINFFSDGFGDGKTLFAISINNQQTVCFHCLCKNSLNGYS
jgi:hypothetical protein